MHEARSTAQRGHREAQQVYSQPLPPASKPARGRSLAEQEAND